MKLFIDDLYGNFTHSQIMITGAVNLHAFVVDETFQISGSANYESTLDKQIEGLIESNTKLATAHRLAVDFGGIQMKNIESTILGWTGSEKPRFNVTVMLPSIDPGKAESNYNSAKLLTAGLYPLGGNDAKVRLTPPNGYSKLTGAGRISVKIGNWFLATKQVLTGVDLNYSKEVTPEEYPTYITGTISFEPDRMLTSDTLMEYYIL